ncbi:short chain dehydrogenase [Coniosporium apollinis CBS 100218]|uniref:Short chain dehydrogenase n=1 Tax=Coniosporium apollinis (strain CBS 100218) TaxID=1168221 RepID=R7YKZ3_CONA1|nr:short chain dehydrogenase [Coniosporium apollinis CBS 100218]EON62577.1 short chain dehydrogenase [Coniosporium apollinis CBS 100218]
MSTPIRLLPNLIRRVPLASPIALRASCLAALANRRCFGTTRPLKNAEGRGPPQPPSDDKADAARSFLGTQKRLPEFSLTDKVILVSGGARGLGLTQAEALLEAGATVYALDRLPEPSEEFPKLQAKAQNELGTALHYRQIDVRDASSLTQIVADIASEHGRLDGLIAAAGIQQETPALEYTAEDANRMFEVNITGVFMTAQAVAKQMVRFGSGGSIVLIASMSGSVANRGLICPAYNTSKAGVIQLARNLAMEWGQYGIRVNTISPGYIVTQMVTMLFEKFPERETEWATQNMLGRLSKPQEYRGAAVFLLSDASSFMTGADLKIDGGHTAW